MEGPWCRTAPGPRRNLLHHRPTLVLRRPSVSADPAVTLPGVRGSRLLDRRPPHYRCPAVPGLKSHARAILTVPGSSVLPSAISHLPSATAYCTVACESATLRQPAPSPVLPWLRTRCRTSRRARPQPTPAPEYCSLTSLPPGSSSLPGPTVSLGYGRNRTHKTAGCLLRQTQIL